jgi:hypothetical protein
MLFAEVRDARIAMRRAANVHMEGRTKQLVPVMSAAYGWVCSESACYLANISAGIS